MKLRIESICRRAASALEKRRAKQAGAAEAQGSRTAARVGLTEKREPYLRSPGGSAVRRSARPRRSGPGCALPSAQGRSHYITCAVPPLREDVACSLAPGESPRLPRELGERNWRRSTPGGSALQHEPTSSRSRSRRLGREQPQQPPPPVAE